MYYIVKSFYSKIVNFINTVEDVMFYKKNDTHNLPDSLFKEPTSEYRGTPFWAWNCKLTSEELTWQIEKLKEMGFGGFHMHSRDGMATEYLSDEFFDLVKACNNKAKEENMLCYLYDEDKWPSGFAGGYVTKDVRYRSRNLIMTTSDDINVTDLSPEEAVNEGKDFFIAAYDVTLNSNGTLGEYKKIARDCKALGTKWYAFCAISRPSAWYNNQTYIDTLNKEAVDKFVSITHEAYKKNVGKDFGNTIHSIFTDEPQFSHKNLPAFAHDTKPLSFTWTPLLPKIYKGKYGNDILDTLPEIFWDLPENKPSVTRYRYHDLICDIFAKTFSDNIGSWCEKNGISLTGHVMDEHSLFAQTNSVGEVMRLYRGFGIPGIDVLLANYEFTTAKQCQSAKRQFGREAMLSELYGVTNYDFDFRGHKLHGDWQAAMGVTIRVPHLSWVSMGGCAKRDYPATINYQAPWYKEYKTIEDHFARINTALTRGTDIVDVAVIHPIESYWINFGPNDTSGDIRCMLQTNFENLSNYLVTGLIDYDYISESLLPELYTETDNGFCVGKMKYKTIIVPGCITLRRSTFELLKKYKNKGGRILFVGECPKYIDLEETSEIKDFYNICEHIDLSRTALLTALSDERRVSVFTDKGFSSKNLIHTMTRDGDSEWLFLCHVHTEPDTTNIDVHGNRIHGRHTYIYDTIIPEEAKIIIKGEFSPVLYDTMTGDIVNLPYRHENGNTVIFRRMYRHDSLLIKLTPTDVHELCVEKEKKSSPTYNIDFKDTVKYIRESENVLLLDIAEYKLDNGEWREKEEILRLDSKLRKEIGIPDRLSGFAQPWSVTPEPITHTVSLRFTIKAEYEAKDVILALEDVDKAVVRFNGQIIDKKIVGYFTDKAISKIKLGDLKKGYNTIEVSLPIGVRTNTEWCYLLGEFNVRVEGCEKTVIAPTEKIGFGSLINQGLPFYGGNLTYETEIETKDCDLEITANLYRGALIKVLVDGEEAGNIFMSPYTVRVSGLTAGRHKVCFKYFGNLYNTFGALHNCTSNDIMQGTWCGPSYWYSTNDDWADDVKLSGNWTYGYNLKDTGILSSPVIHVYEK